MISKESLKKKKIAVLCGGRSSEREVSLRSGKRVFESLIKQGFNAVKIDPKYDIIKELKKNKVDAAFIVLHGEFGEDGAIQGLLHIEGIPFTGSGILTSALAMNKVAAKRIFESLHITTPKYTMINPNDAKGEAERISKTFPFPVVIKPVSEGSSFGVSIVKDRSILEDVILNTAKKFKEIFAEEYIKGKEVTVGILGDESLPILELAPKAEFYDYESKYTKGGTQFILPANLPEHMTKLVKETALMAHKALGCKGFSRVDIIIDSTHIPYVHEVNTIPGMTEQSDLPAEAECAGISFDELVVRILQSAYEKK